MNISSDQSELARVDILELSDSSRADLDEVAAMHLELLSFGPMAGMGRRFIREICYRGLLRTGIFRVAICRIDGQAAGFIAYTAKSSQFHRIGLTENWLGACRETMLAIIANPDRIRDLFRSLRVLRSRRSEPDNPPQSDGEVVCVAVRPKYLGRTMKLCSGRRVSVELILYAAKRLSSLGVTKMRMLIDHDNKSVMLLYHSLGGEFTPFEQAGERMYRVDFGIERLLKDHGEEDSVDSSGKPGAAS